MAKKDTFYTAPLNGFMYCDTDSDSSPAYYGYENIYGAWIIMRVVEDDNTRYAYGTGNYSSAWTNRASQTYDLPHVVFSDLK